MKPVLNRKKYVCGCCVLSSKTKSSLKTEEELHRIYSYYEHLEEKYCMLNSKGECLQKGANGHTKVGIVQMKYCPKCNSPKYKFISHEPFIEERLVSISSNILRLPPPSLRRPTSATVREANAYIAGRRDRGDEEDEYNDDYGLY